MKTIADVVAPRNEKVLPKDCPELEFLGLDDIEAHTMRLIGGKAAGSMKSSAKRFYRGDVLYSRLRPYLNKVWCANRDGICSSEFIVLPGNDSVDAKFLAFRLFASDFVAFANGLNAGDRPRVDFGQVSIFPFPDFSLEVQRAIAARIEALFSELDKGIEALKTSREQLKVYRQVLVDDALHGAKHNLATVPLAELICDIQQGWSPKCELNRRVAEGEWAIIKTTAVQPMHYASDECKPLPAEFTPRADIEVKVGDFLMTRKGPRNRTGVVCLVRNTRSHSMLCDTVYRFRCDESTVDPGYLEMVLNSPSLVAEIDRRKSGISDSGISLNHGKIKSLPIPLIAPPRNQRELVEKVRSKLEPTSQLLQEIEACLLRAEIIRQSILKKAFCGQLVEKQPSVASIGI